MAMTDADAQEILKGNGAVIAREAERLANALNKDVKGSQIRNFYGPMIRLRDSSPSPADALNGLFLMIPRLAYLEARSKRGNFNPARPLREDFEILIKKANQANLQHIFSFAEALVGYHKAFSE
jgi:CRISPR type III-A-associated protein Csm2